MLTVTKLQWQKWINCWSSGCRIQCDPQWKSRQLQPWHWFRLQDATSAHSNRDIVLVIPLLTWLPLACCTSTMRFYKGKALLWEGNICQKMISCQLPEPLPWNKLTQRNCRTHFSSLNLMMCHWHSKQSKAMKILALGLRLGFTGFSQG